MTIENVKPGSAAASNATKESKKNQGAGAGVDDSGGSRTGSRDNDDGREPGDRGREGEGESPVGPQRTKKSK